MADRPAEPSVGVRVVCEKEEPMRGWRQLIGFFMLAIGILVTTWWMTRPTPLIPSRLQAILNGPCRQIDFTCVGRVPKNRNELLQCPEIVAVCLPMEE